MSWGELPGGIEFDAAQADFADVDQVVPQRWREQGRRRAVGERLVVVDVGLVDGEVEQRAFIPEPRFHAQFQ